MTANRSRRGFTLLELLVVVAILTTVVGLLVPTIITVRQEAQKTVCLTQLKELGRAALVYSEDRDGEFPLAPGQPAYRSLQLLLDAEIIEDPAWLVCPSSPDDLPARPDAHGLATLTPGSCSYAWAGVRTKANGPGDHALGSDDAIEDDSRGIREGHRGGMNVVFAGLHGSWIDEEELPPELKLPERLVDNEPPVD